MIILATNRPFDLDEAMHRRITLAIEFSKPDGSRKKCWKLVVTEVTVNRQSMVVASFTIRTA